MQQQRLEEQKMYANTAGLGMAGAGKAVIAQLLGAVLSPAVERIVASSFLYEFMTMFETPRGEAAIRAFLNTYIKNPESFAQAVKPFAHIIPAGKSVLIKPNRNGETTNYSIPVGKVEKFATELAHLVENTGKK